MLKFHIDSLDLALWLLFALVLIYWLWFKCWHKWELIKVILVEKNNICVGHKIVNRCKHCGQIAAKEL